MEDHGITKLSSSPTSVTNTTTTIMSSSLSLPLLSGLSKRKNTSSKALEDALKEYKAFCIIGRNVKCWVDKIRQRKQKEKEGMKEMEVDAKEEEEEDGEGIKEEEKKRFVAVGGGGQKRRKITSSGAPSPPPPTNNDDDIVAKIIHPTSSSFSPPPPLSQSKYYHWLLRSLLSPSIRVRRAASRMILDASSSSSPTSLSLKDAVLLRNALHSLVDTSLFSFSSTSKEEEGVYYQDVEGGDPSVQLLGLLSYFVCDAEFFREKDKKKEEEQSSGEELLSSMISAAASAIVASNSGLGSGPGTAAATKKSKSGSEGLKKVEKDSSSGIMKKILDNNNNTSSATSEKCISKDTTTKHWSIESFVASGGLRWATRSIVSLISLLLHRSTTTVSPPPPPPHPEKVSRSSLDSTSVIFTEGKNQKMDEVQMEVIQVRIVLLVDFVYRLVMYASIPSSTTTTTTTTTTKAKSGESSRTSGGVTKSGGGVSSSSSGKNEEVNKDKEKRKIRRETLQRVSKLLWSENLPATYISSSASLETNTTNSIITPLSPLACLITAHEVLRSTYASSNSIPYKIRGMDRCVATLSRLVDFSSNVMVVASSFSSSSMEEKKEKKEEKKKDVSSSSRGIRETFEREGGRSSNSGGGGRSMRELRRRRLNKRSNPSSEGSSSRYRGSSNTAAASASPPAPPSSFLERLVEQHQQLEAAAASSSNERPSSSSSPPFNSSSRPGGRRSSSSSAATAAAAAMSSFLFQSSSSSPPPSSYSNTRDSNRGRNNTTTATTATTSSDSAAMARTVSEAISVLNRSRSGGGDSNNNNENSTNRQNEDNDSVMEEINEEEEDEDHDEDEDHEEEEDDDEDGKVAEEEDEEIESDEDHDDDDNDDDEDDEDNDDENEEDMEEDAHDDDDDDDEDDEEEEEEGGQFDDAIIVVDDDDEPEEEDDDEDGRRDSVDLEEEAKAAALAIQETKRSSSSSNTNTAAAKTAETTTTQSHALSKEDKKCTFLKAAMQVLVAQYISSSSQHSHTLHRSHGSITAEESTTSSSPTTTKQKPPIVTTTTTPILTPPLLTSTAEQSLLKSICDIVKPPRKPLNLKIFMRRAPTQEEFFRGSLSRNPISLSSLRSAGTTAGTGSNDRSTSGGGASSTSGNTTTTGGGASSEPLVRDLRQHIANDLQMSDSAELLELLVANKILDMNLKLRVVQQVLWKKHVSENAMSTSSILEGGGGSQQMISTGSGLSMIFSTGLGGGGSSSRNASSRNNSSGNNSSGGNSDNNSGSISSYPPMVVTYRLAGVDGEATEDKVEDGDLDDPEAPASSDSKNVSSEIIEKRMEKEYGITRLVTEGRGVSVLLRSIESFVSDMVRRIRRDDVGRGFLLKGAASGGGGGSSSSSKGKNSTREKFLKSPACPALILLRHCAQLTDNRKKLVKARAPTLLLRMLLDVLNAIDTSSSSKSNSRRRSFSISAMDVDDNETNSASDNNDASSGGGPPPRSHHSSVGNNPTADALQELIEILASDISAEASNARSKSKPVSKNAIATTTKEDTVVVVSDTEENEDVSTLPLVLSSLRTTSLSPPLRKVIAKLLPFLTYGQVDQSTELASKFIEYVSVDALTDAAQSSDAEKEECTSMLMETFVESAIHLPAVSVCDTLRNELIRQGFVDRVKAFVLRDAPSQPPPWSSALFAKNHDGDMTEEEKKAKKELYETQWRRYFSRPGLHTAFRILIGLCTTHGPTQSFIADMDGVVVAAASSDDTEKTSSATIEDESSVVASLLTICHWIESTSDNTASNISMNGLGLLSETLLDALGEDNDMVTGKINAIRKKTRTRKREIAEERRSRALVGMTSFGPIAGAAAATGTSLAAFGSAAASASAGNEPSASADANDGVAAAAARGAGSALTSMFGLPGLTMQRVAEAVNSVTSASAPSILPTMPSSASSSGKANKDKSAKSTQPSWLSEMENMEDEAGLTCAVCQEGRTLQPSELLGLYAYMKKVSLPYNQGGGKGNIDGTVLLLSLPRTLPSSLAGTEMAEAWFQPARTAAEALQSTPHAASSMAAATAVSSSSSSRPSHFITTVTAGNAIHCTCHTRARAADRNHPKAPKSEWEGASLRNSRVTCNVIFPLVSSKSSKVPLVAVESALADYQTVVSNLLGTRPKSMLWSVLHDIRFMIIRMAYGEALNVDCGGGSLSSNSSLLFYQMFMANMFANDAEHDAPGTAMHARELSAGFLAAYDIVKSDAYHQGTTLNRLKRSLADAAPMAALCCILLQNTFDENVSGPKKRDNTDEITSPASKRRWKLHRNRFLCGLIRCAGRRHALGVKDSGCSTSRGGAAGKRRVVQSSSFADWDLMGCDDEEKSSENGSAGGTKRESTVLGKRKTPDIDEYAAALRPMITLYAIFDQLSAEFMPNMDDESVEKSAGRLVETIEKCHKAGSIHDLLSQAGVDMDHDTILEEIESGITLA